MEADKRSVDSIAKELETVKKDQARQQVESIAQHKKEQQAQQLAKEKHKKFLALTDENISRVSKTFRGNVQDRDAGHDRDLGYTSRDLPAHFSPHTTPLKCVTSLN